jgi:hypothetical protein
MCILRLSSNPSGENEHRATGNAYDALRSTRAFGIKGTLFHGTVVRFHDGIWVYRVDGDKVMELDLEKCSAFITIAKATSAVNVLGRHIAMR